MNRFPILYAVALRMPLLPAIVLAFALVACKDTLTEDRVRAAVPGTWVGTFVPTTGSDIGVPRRMELRIFTAGQYNFLVQDSAGVEIEHAGTWSLQSDSNGLIHIVGSGASSESFDIINLRVIHLYYQDTTVEFTRQ